MRMRCVFVRVYTLCVCAWMLYIMREYFHLFIVFIFAHPSLSARRRVFVLAAALWQYVLPPRSSASLYDPADDEWRFESEGKLAGVHAAQIWTIPLRAPLGILAFFLTYFKCAHISVSSLCILLLYLAAVRRWPSELDKGVRRSQRNKPFLLPPARRCGG